MDYKNRRSKETIEYQPALQASAYPVVSVMPYCYTEMIDDGSWLEPEGERRSYRFLEPVNRIV